MYDDFRRALEEVKLRAPVEDVVREYVPELKKRGSLWVACCPFHEERTPSFKVDPRRGTWHCFGACSEGGDQIRFVERIRNVGFRDALEILAARAGVELPQARAPRPGKRPEDQPVLALLDRAARFFEARLSSPDGAAARAYLAQRGLNEESSAAFRLGWAPAAGRAMCEAARGQGVPFEQLERAGLARRNDRGHAYDFFRGRLIIPIQDLEGRVVGFGAREIAGDGRGPKYVNSPETELFRKSRLVYGLDRALATVRKSGHLVLVEGYTDVIAAHQAGATQVGAVLGTATTTEHAGAIRRSGARRISLVFDGDEAGRRAARRALDGLLPLGVELQVVEMAPGEDPCDLVVRGGQEAFEAALAAGRDWFEFLMDGLTGLSGAELSEAADGLLELLARIEKPVHREDLKTRMAAGLGIAREALEAQWKMHPAARPRRARPALPGGGTGSGATGSGASEPGAMGGGATGRGGNGPGTTEAGAEPPPDPRVQAETRRIAGAWRGLVVAALRDESLVPALRERVEGCPEPDLRRVLELLTELYETSTEDIDESVLLTALEDHPARNRVVGLFQEAASLDAPRKLLEDNLRHLRRLELDREQRELTARILLLQRRCDEARQNTARCSPSGASHEPSSPSSPLSERLLPEGEVPEPETTAVAVADGPGAGLALEQAQAELEGLLLRDSELRDELRALGERPD